MNINFEKFCEIYFKDIEPRLKYNTFLTKKHIIEHKILPYFSSKKINEIKPADVIQWQKLLIIDYVLSSNMLLTNLSL